MFTGYQDHPVHTSASNLASLAPEVDAAGQSENVINDLAWMVETSAFVAERLRLLDPRYLVKDDVEGYQQQLDASHSYLEKYKSETTQPAHLSRSKNALLSVFNGICPRPMIGETEDGLQSAAREFRNALQESNRVSSDAVQALAVKLDEIKAEVGTAKESSEEVEEKLAATNKELEELGARFQEAFAAAESERGEEFSAQLGAMKELSTSETEEAIVEFGTAATLAIEEIEAIHQRATKLLAVTSSIVLAGDYGVAAKDNSDTADKLRGFAVVYFTLLTGAMIYVGIQATSVDWGVTLFRVFATGLLSLPALYLARESQVHRKEAVRNRRIQVELASLQPFIAEFPDDEQKAITKELIDRYFVGEKEGPSNDDSQG